MLDFNGKPLFLWSVEAALDAGIKPVVYTDSDEIANISEANNAQVVRRPTEEDEKMEAAVTTVLNAVDTDAFVILQPTSPLRVPGLMSNVFAYMDAKQFDSAYTYSRIKPIGHFGDTFYRGGRDQDTTQWFDWADGNMFFSTVDFFKEHGTFLAQESKPIEDLYPCALQLDYPKQMDALLAFTKKRRYRVFLPGTVHKVAVVSNKERFVRNYSQLIDSCDAVIRVSKMANLYTGTAGTITDIIGVENSKAYFCHNNVQRKSKELLKAPVVWCFKDHNLEAWHKEFPFNQGVMLPVWRKINNAYHTTYMVCVDMAYRCWSRCHVYGIGTLNIPLRTSLGYCWHKLSNENTLLDKYIHEGKFTLVDEDDIPSEEGYKYKYST